MNSKLNLVASVNNVMGALAQVAKALKKRDYGTAIAHSMMAAQSAVNAIEAFHILEVEVTKELERK